MAAMALGGDQAALTAVHTVGGSTFRFESRNYVYCNVMQCVSFVSKEQLMF